jgi:hypothetical protein
VKRVQSKSFQDEEIERALGQFQPFVSHAGFTLPLLHKTIKQSIVEAQEERSAVPFRPFAAHLRFPQPARPQIAEERDGEAGEVLDGKISRQTVTHHRRRVAH